MGTLCNGIKNINDIMESKDEDHQTEEPTVSVSNGSSLADLDEKEHQEGITDEATAGPAGTTMKLVIRSPYWGRVLKGKPRRDQYNSGRPYRIFQCQAILNQKGRYWGCCPNHGKRVLELKEYHFTECYPQSWDLYMIGSCVQPSSIIHSFFLLPQNQMVVDIDSHVQFDGWRYFGTIQASALRMDLESLLYDFLAQNNDYGFNFHHVHVDLLMDQVTDREAESNRLKTQARRAERLQQHQQAANGGNIGKNGTEQPQQSGGVIPPPGIPHVISSDASWSAETIRSNNMTAGGPENWNDPSFHPGYGSRTQGPPPPFGHGQWVTAAASVGHQHMMGPNHNAALSAGQPIPPIQQALQNFPMPQSGMQQFQQQFQMGYIPPAHTYYHPPTYGQQQAGGAAAPQPLPEGWSSTESTIPPYCVPAPSDNAAGTTHPLAEDQQPQQQRDDSVP